MKIQISDNLIKHYLQNVYFITGHSCAGKSTMVKMLAERYGMICHVAVMLCDPPDVCATRFFDRDDPEKRFMLEQIKLCRDPEATRKNFDSWMRYRPPEEIDWQHTGFFTYTRSDFENDTREEVLSVLAEHFGL